MARRDGSPFRAARAHTGSSPARAPPGPASRRYARRRGAPASPLTKTWRMPVAYGAAGRRWHGRRSSPDRRWRDRRNSPARSAPAFPDAQIGGRQRGQPPHRFLQRHQPLVADIAAEQPREIAIGARVRIGIEEHAFGRRRAGVGAEAHPGQARPAAGHCPRSSGNRSCRPGCRPRRPGRSRSPPGDVPRSRATSASVLPT